eukprot:TRINITY_DN2610_c0_g2_i1.p1 TRINITY_DN2610_c0_g2~~TRINITY_DN2610_c0_g2_i1.p1  ORF type:complete len:262 (+),score=27.37 TRINITY_DN2610_c0_g2_i1:500-1285(+)
MTAMESAEADKNAAAPEVGEGAAGAAAVEAVARHPLEHRWTLWFDNPTQRGKGGGGWGSSLRTIFTFGSVEEFWCLYNNVVAPSKLVNKADMHLFKEGIAPKWEDPKCEKGGSWTIPCSRSKEYLDTVWLHTVLALIGEQLEQGADVCGAVVNIRTGKDRVAVWTIPCSRSKEYLDTVWLHTVLALIGEQLEQGADVCGAVVNIRTGKDRVAVWTKSAGNEQVQMSIGKQLKEILDVSDRIGYASFADQKGSRSALDKYTV